jgi:predicted RNase H-like HicB family nuclease
MVLTITLYEDEDGMWISECPSIPGCISQGDSLEDAVVSIGEAIALCLEVRREVGMPLTVQPHTDQLFP